MLDTTNTVGVVAGSCRVADVGCFSTPLHPLAFYAYLLSIGYSLEGSWAVQAGGAAGSSAGSAGAITYELVCPTPAGGDGGAPSLLLRPTLTESNAPARQRPCVRTCACARMCVCGCMCVRARARVCVCVREYARGTCSQRAMQSLR